MTEHDPVSLAETLLTRIGQVSTSGPRSMPVANDGRAIIVTSPLHTYWDVLPQILPGLPASEALTDDGRTAAASGNGARVLIGDPGRLLRYKTDTGQLVPIANNVPVTALHLNRDGSRTLITDTNGSIGVYDDSAPVLLGKLPATTRAAVLALDELLAFSYDQDGTVRVFDLDAPQVAGEYPQIGAGITLASSPGSPSGPIKMAVSPDGGTVFVAGAQQAVVVPIP